MRHVTIAAALALSLPFGSAADKPKVNRGQIAAMEEAIDKRLRSISSPADPVEVVGLTQGMYINGYGAVFASELNLAPSPGISPFHPTISKDDVVRIHGKKLERMPKLREAMQEILLNSAGSLDPVPGDEQIALGITLFYWQWEDKAGLPVQIVMHASKSSLVKVKSGAEDRASLKSNVVVEEF